MKPIVIFSLFILAMVFAQFAHAQTADDVVNKYLTAMGGKEKMNALKTVKQEGSLSVMGNDVAIVLTKKHLVGMRMDISVMGTENYQVVTPTKGIMFMPVQGMSEPTDMPAEQLKAAQSQLDIQGTLVDYKEKGTAVELVGKEKAEGVDCFNLKITYKSGVVANFFIDEKTGRIIKTASKRVINGEETEVSNIYSNYKQNADGYWFPYTSTNSQGTTEFSKIETNVAVDDKIFN